MKCHLKVKSIDRGNSLKPGTSFVFFIMNGLFDITYGCWIRGTDCVWEKMTVRLSSCWVYLAKAAFAQHHEEVEVVDAHFDFAGNWGVDGRTGRDGGRGQGRRERLRHWGG